MNGLISYRASEDFILDRNGDVKIPGKTVQYLTGYQLKGVQFLFKNYENGNSSIINDESGLGKCAQIATFLKAIIVANSDTVIIICPDKVRALHWCYHLTIFAPFVKFVEIDASLEELQPINATVYITTIDVAVSSQVVNGLKCTLLVLDEVDERCSTNQLISLDDLEIVKKIVVCRPNILLDIEHFYYILNFCDQLASFNSSKSRMKDLSLHEFKAKYGSYGDKSLSQRNINLRLTNLLNICSDFYIRRQRSKVTNNLPLINDKIFAENFNHWKKSYPNTTAVPTDTKPSKNRDFDSAIEQSGQEFSENLFIYDNPTEPFDCDSDTQFSPLIYEYSDSEPEEDYPTVSVAVSEKSESIGIYDENFPNGQTRLRNDPCAEESTSVEDHKYEENDRSVSPRITRAQSYTHSTSRLTRSKLATKPNSVKKRIYKELDISTKERKRAFESKKVSSSRTEKPLQKEHDHNQQKTDLERRVSNTPDVQIVSPKRYSPICVAGSSEALCPEQDTPSIASEAKCDTHRCSPDIFAIFDGSETNSANSDNVTTRTHSLQHAGHVPEVSTPQPHPVKVQAHGSVDLFAESIETISPIPNGLNGSTNNNKTPDIFEITKNNVFHNVIRLGRSTSMSPIPVEDKPVKRTKTTSDLDRSCFSGLRLVLPKLRLENYTDLTPTKRDRENAAAKEKTTTKSSVCIDLTDTQPITPSRRARRNAQDVVNLISEASSSQAEIEKTPTSKRLLTPSTRSCLKRQHNEQTGSGEKEPVRSPQSTINCWLSKRNSLSKEGGNNASGTPNSRRRLDTSFASVSKVQTVKDKTPMKPRMLFQGMRAGNRLTRSKSVSALESPIIVFSSDEE